MLKFRDEIHKYITTHKDEIIDTLKELVKIPSVRGEAIASAPFGKACADVLEYTENLYRESGFGTELDKEGGYLLSYHGNGEKSIGLFAHADVVPVGDDWTLTKPFEPIEKNGFLVGRGVLDDKSAIVISLYCAKMLKELDLPFTSRLICYTGSNEESGMEDIKNYLKKHNPPYYSLVNDTAFPLFRGNKGMLKFYANSKVSLDTIRAIDGSNVKGSVLGEAMFKTEYSQEIFQFLKDTINDDMSVDTDENEIRISVKGISKHTALPEGSINAASLLSDVLSKCEHIGENDRTQMIFLHKILSDYYGKTIGINTEDEFGKLTIVNDTIELNNDKINMHFNLRFGDSVNIEELKNKIKDEFSENGFDVDFESESPAFLLEENHPLVKMCMRVFKEYTGNENAKPYINAGGTYAKHLPSAIEIGTTLIGGLPEKLPQGHGAVHQSDECISIDGMLEALELTMLMLLECDKDEIQ